LRDQNIGGIEKWSRLGIHEMLRGFIHAVSISDD
jgi:hypothetical protein